MVEKGGPAEMGENGSFQGLVCRTKEEASTLAKKCWQSGTGIGG